MQFFDRMLTTRINKEIEIKIAEIIRRYPDRFDDESDVVRASIINFHNRLIGGKDGC